MKGRMASEPQDGDMLYVAYHLDFGSFLIHMFRTKICVCFQVRNMCRIKTKPVGAGEGLEGHVSDLVAGGRGPE